MGEPFIRFSPRKLKRDSEVLSQDCFGGADVSGSPWCPVLAGLTDIEIRDPVHEAPSSFVGCHSCNWSSALIQQTATHSYGDLPPPSSQYLSNPTPFVISVLMKPG